MIKMVLYYKLTIAHAIDFAMEGLFLKYVDIIMKLGLIEEASNENKTGTINDFKYFLDGIRLISFISVLKLESTISSLKSDIKKLLNQQQTDYAKEIISNIASQITGLYILLIANIIVIILITFKYRKLKIEKVG
jgi:hypothetical protein